MGHLIDWHKSSNPISEEGLIAHKNGNSCTKFLNQAEFQRKIGEMATYPQHS